MEMVKFVSYQIVVEKQRVGEHRDDQGWCVLEDSSHRPPPCQGDALTN